MLIDKRKVNKKLRDIALGAIETVENVTNVTKKVVDKSSEVIVETLDANRDGEADIEDIIIAALRTPGSRVDREEFFRKVFEEKYGEETIEVAIKKNPLKASISMIEIDEIANEIIKSERNFVTGISATLGTQGGVGLIAAVPADIIQYHVYLIRIAQKLLYLYGFPKIDMEEKSSGFDEATINLFTICLGIMNEIEGTSDAIKVVSKAQYNGSKKRDMKKILTEGVIEEEAEDAAEWFEERMVKSFIASSVKAMVPIVSSVICGTSTFASFETCADNLRDVLKDTALSNPGHEESKEEKKLWKKLEQVVIENKNKDKEE
ncbi:MAG: hypothetical protein IKL68_06025 [Clostridia bacterium]|nr:hypothetical protein [Clostridia bacterium]